MVIDMVIFILLELIFVSFPIFRANYITVCPKGRANCDMSAVIRQGQFCEIALKRKNNGVKMISYVYL